MPLPAGPTHPELRRVDEVRVAAFNAARNARDRLMAAPRLVSAIIAAIGDAKEVEGILEEEVEQICVELSEATWH